MDVETVSCSDLEPLSKILADRPVTDSSSLIPILQDIQEAYRYLPPDVLKELSRRTGIPASQIYGVATFYEQFYLEPHGKHTVRCCRGTACHVRGGHGMIRAVKSILGIEEGETTEDMLFTFETVACLGACALAPVMVINGVYYGKMTSHRAKTVIGSLRSLEEEAGR